MTEFAGRVLIIIENNPVPFDRRAWRQTQALRTAGYQVSVITPAGPTENRLVRPDSTGEPFEVLDSIHIYRYPQRFAESGLLLYLWEYAWALMATTWLSLRILVREGFDIVQFCNPPDLFFPLGWFYKLPGKRIVFDHRDLFPESCAYVFHGSFGRLVHRLALWAERLTFRMTDVVVSANESYRRIAIERGGVPSEWAFVVVGGPELATFRSASPDPTLRRGKPHLVCYLGTMGAQDGVELMLEAIQWIVNDEGRDDVQFVLIGDGPLRTWAVEKTAEWGLGDAVVLSGRLPEEDVRRYLSTADVCLSPDPCTPLNDVSTMTKVMEYMAIGRPIVSFDLQEARRTAGEAAVYVLSGDARAFGRAILDLLEDPERRRQMGEAGRRRVEMTLAWEHQKGQFLAAYSTVMNIQQQQRRPKVEGALR